MPRKKQVQSSSNKDDSVNTKDTLKGNVFAALISESDEDTDYQESISDKVSGDSELEVMEENKKEDDNKEAVNNNTHNIKEENMEPVVVGDNNNDNNKDKYIPPGSMSNGNNGWTVFKKKHKQGEKINNKEHHNVNDEIEYYNPNVELDGDNLKLNSHWRVWVHQNENQNWDLASYEKIYMIDSVGSMWRFLSNFGNLDKSNNQFYIMRREISPIWEDNSNKNGGIFSMMIDCMNRNDRIDFGVEVMMAVCILIMNESFIKNGDDINCINYSVKNRNVLIKIWVKDFDRNEDFVNKLPISFLHKIDQILQNDSRKGFQNRRGRSKVSIKYDRIHPEW